ncbi:MAG: 50S ribosomal protein L5 [Candidatus Daviesbacteria bacterium]
MNRLQEKYKKEVVPVLQEELKTKNILALPTLNKIVINVGVGDAKDHPETLDKIVTSLSALSGQKPLFTKAKKSIAGFKLAKGNVVGLMITLRGSRMYEFLDKLMNIVLSKVRDFRGVSPESFDNQGNFNLGLREQTIFPEVSYEIASAAARGMEITIVTTAKNKEEGKRLLELLGMPFRREVHG